LLLLITFGQYLTKIGENIIKNLIIKVYVAVLVEASVRFVLRILVLTGSFLSKSTLIISAVTISMVLLFSPYASSVFNAFAQTQGGSATGGPANGGAATASGITDGTCNQCTINNAPQGGSATGGPVTGGSASSGSASGGAGVDFVPVKIQPGGPMKNGGPCTMTFTTGKWILSSNDGRWISYTPSLIDNIGGPSSSALEKICSMLNLSPDQMRNLIKDSTK